MFRCFDRGISCDVMMWSGIAGCYFSAIPFYAWSFYFTYMKFVYYFLEGISVVL